VLALARPRTSAPARGSPVLGSLEGALRNCARRGVLGIALAVTPVRLLRIFIARTLDRSRTPLAVTPVPARIGVTAARAGQRSSNSLQNATSVGRAPSGSGASIGQRRWPSSGQSWAHAPRAGRQ